MTGDQKLIILKSTKRRVSIGIRETELNQCGFFVHWRLRSLFPLQVLKQCKNSRDYMSKSRFFINNPSNNLYIQFTKHMQEECVVLHSYFTIRLLTFYSRCQGNYTKVHEQTGPDIFPHIVDFMLFSTRKE